MSLPNSNTRLDWVTGTKYDVRPHNEPPEAIDLAEQAMRLSIPNRAMRQMRVLEMQRMRVAAYFNLPADSKALETIKDVNLRKARKPTRPNLHGGSHDPWTHARLTLPTVMDIDMRGRGIPGPSVVGQLGASIVEKRKSLIGLKGRRPHWADRDVLEALRPGGGDVLRHAGGKKIGRHTSGRLPMSDFKKAELRRRGALAAALETSWSF